MYEHSQGAIMPLSAQEIYESALQLPIDVQATIAEKLVSNIEMHIDPDIEKKHCAIAIKRRDEIRSGKVQSIDGAVALQAVRQVLAA